AASVPVVPVVCPTVPGTSATLASGPPSARRHGPGASPGIVRRRPGAVPRRAGRGGAGVVPSSGVITPAEDAQARAGPRGPVSTTVLTRGRRTATRRGARCRGRAHGQGGRPDRPRPEAVADGVHGA